MPRPATHHPPMHRTVAADRYRVPAPFRCFAVRSDEPAHAGDARSPCAQVQVVHTRFLDAAARASIAAQGLARVSLRAFSDIEHSLTSLAELAATVPQVADLPGALAGALALTGVLGHDPAAYQAPLATRIDHLGTCGAGFHNDVGGHWSRCLFWLLAVQVADVEFVMPHAGVRLALAPGDLLVFDPALAHGLCRPADGGLARAESFAPDASGCQLFLTGELPLGDAQWAALGAPWQPLAVHAARGALDLGVASFDDRSGTIQRVQALRGCMQADAGPAGTAAAPG